MTLKINLKDIVGGGYGSFWRSHARYRVVKGSRGSKKSKTIALNMIYLIMKYPMSNVLVVRKVKDTLRDSCFSDLKWAIKRFDVEEFFTSKTSPLEIIYKPTGQKILFRGLDDPLKITSISVDIGYLNFLWIEEAYEISNEDDFNMLDESIRGQTTGSYKQITLSFNPWNEKHWIKKRFFDEKKDNIFTLTTTYHCNEWLDESDRQMFEDMKKRNPRRYRVAGLGEWGVIDGLIYDNVLEQSFDIDEIRKKEGVNAVFGLDFGYTNDPSALFCGLYDRVNYTLYVFDEIYKKGLSNREIFKEIEKKSYLKEKIVADSAEPKSIAELRDLGVRRIQGARKGKDSVNNGIQQIQDIKIIVHPKCVNFLMEIGMYVWKKDKFGKKINEPVDDNNHLMDAMRYAMESITSKPRFSFK